MKKICLLLLLILSSLSLTAVESKDQQSGKVLVTIAPYRYFVHRIAGDLVTVDLLVPKGASSHSYEPSPRQMISVSKADIWFKMGESMEARALPALKSHNPNLVVVDLQQGLDLIEGHCHHGAHYCHESIDLHFWLSPLQAKIQAKTIAEAMIKVYPEKKAVFEDNLQKFLVDLETLHQQITTILSLLKERTILVGHPAFGYFCRDYQLKQLSIEFEGRDPTPKQLTNIIQTAKDLKIRTIFIQEQYSNKGAKLIAEELGAKTVYADPYAENYPEALKKFAEHIAQQQDAV